MSSDSEIEVIDGPSAEEELALVKEHRNPTLDLVLFLIAGSIGFVLVSLLTRYVGSLLSRVGPFAKTTADLIRETPVGSMI